MKRNGDVMRSDRLKQVMQEIDPTFDEKDLGMSKFSRFVQEAHQKGLLSMTKLENGQLEIGPPATAPVSAAETRPTEADQVEVDRSIAATDGAAPTREAAEPQEEREERSRRGRRSRGRGRGREREDRSRAPASTPSTPDLQAPLQLAEESVAVGNGESIGTAGERLTRNEAFDLVRRAVETLTTDDDDTTRASDIRQRAREVLGRDSESLNERMFIRILKDAHDSGVIDLRRRGDDFEVARAAVAVPVADQVARADAASAPPRPSLGAPPPRLGMGPRGAGRGRGRSDGPPPELLALGVVEEASSVVQPAPAAIQELPPSESAAPSPKQTEAAAPAEIEPEQVAPRGGRKRGKRGTPASVQRQAAEAPATPEPPAPAPTARKTRARTAAKTAHRRARAKKGTPKSES